MMKYSTSTWDLVRAFESASPASCKTLATFINSISPNNSPVEAMNPEMQLNYQEVISYCLAYKHSAQG